MPKFDSTCSVFQKTQLFELCVKQPRIFLLKYTQTKISSTIIYLVCCSTESEISICFFVLFFPLFSLMAQKRQKRKVHYQTNCYFFQNYQITTHLFIRLLYQILLGDIHKLRRLARGGISPNAIDLSTQTTLGCIHFDYSKQGGGQNSQNPVYVVCVVPPPYNFLKEVI